MATASQTTMLRALLAAGDRERTGALDVEWDGARASLFFTFGQASHAELERADGRKLVGNDALSALVEELPEDFRVAPWRRAKVSDDTLRCSAEELMFLFRSDAPAPRGTIAKPKTATKRRSKAPRPAAPRPPEATASEAAPAPAPTDAAQTVPFDLAGFPPLPLGAALFADEAGRVEGLDRALSRLPDCLIVLAADEARGAVFVTGGAIVDAVWVNGMAGHVGAAAAAAVLGAADGRVAAYRVDDPRLAAALPVLWRESRTLAAVSGGSVNVDRFVAAARDLRLSCALLVTESDDPGVALFSEGELVAVYTVSKPAPVSTKAALGRLLRAAKARATLVGVGADAGQPVVVGGVIFPLRTPERVMAEDVPTPPEPIEFVPTRVDVNIDALRAELIDIANAWLGKGDAAVVAAAVNAARPGVHDFVAAIQAISSLEIPGHDNAVVRAMAREMHFRAAEVLCGV